MGMCNQNNEKTQGSKNLYYESGMTPQRKIDDDIEQKNPSISENQENTEIDNKDKEEENNNNKIEKNNNINIEMNNKINIEMNNNKEMNNINNNINTQIEIKNIEIVNNISTEIDNKNIILKNKKIEKSNYLKMDFQKNYKLICPICKSTNIKIEIFEYHKNYDDYKIYFTCNSSLILSNDMLINILDVTDLQDQNYISEHNIEKIREMVENKIEGFKGYPILENILKVNNISFIQSKKDDINNEFRRFYNDFNNPLKQILWFDDNINSDENQKYLDILKNDFENVQTFQKEEELFQIMEKLKFDIYILIINGLNFSKYMKYILNNSLYSIPVSIIFTKNEVELKQKISSEYKEYLEHKFYNPLGISITIENLVKKIKTFIIDYNIEINKIKFGYLSPPKDYKDCFIFEYIDDDSKLIFPFLYNKIMKNAKLTDEEVKQTNKYILKKYGKNEKIKNLIYYLLHYLIY